MMEEISKAESDALVQLTHSCWELTCAHSKVIADMMLKCASSEFMADAAGFIHMVHGHGQRYMEGFVRCIEYLEEYDPKRLAEFRSELDKIGYGR